MTPSNKTKLKNVLRDNLKTIQCEDRNTIDAIISTAEDSAEVALWSFGMGVLLAWIELDLEYLDIGKVDSKELYAIQNEIAKEWSEAYLN